MLLQLRHLRWQQGKCVSHRLAGILAASFKITDLNLFLNCKEKIQSYFFLPYFLFARSVISMICKRKLVASFFLCVIIYCFIISCLIIFVYCSLIHSLNRRRNHYIAVACGEIRYEYDAYVIDAAAAAVVGVAAAAVYLVLRLTEFVVLLFLSFLSSFSVFCFFYL